MDITVNGASCYCYTGGKAFDADVEWFQTLLGEIGQK